MERSEDGEIRGEPVVEALAIDSKRTTVTGFVGGSGAECGLHDVRIAGARDEDVRWRATLARIAAGPQGHGRAPHGHR